MSALDPELKLRQKECFTCVPTYFKDIRLFYCDLTHHYGVIGQPFIPSHHHEPCLVVGRKDMVKIKP